MQRTFVPCIPAIAVTFYLVVSAVLLLSILHLTGGTFVYPLDDPYIHLAMAEQLAHGHYGINAIEASSPSSSILWPFLLVPFAAEKWNVYLPLCWNLLFGTAAAWLIGTFIAGLPSSRSGRAPRWQQAVLAILLVLLANLASLTFVGMEHVLQILLSICCALGAIAVFDGRKMPGWCLAAAVVAPMVRYEDLALTGAVCIVLAGLKQWRKAMLVLGLSLLPLLGFGFFLLSKGLPALPTSVLVKGGATGADGSRATAMLHDIYQNVTLDFRHLERGTLVLLLLLLCFFFVLTLRARSWVRTFIIASAAFVAIMQLLIGRFGWFHRYEVYAYIFVALMLIRLASEFQIKAGFYLAAALLLLCDRPYILGTFMTPRGSLEVYEQQYQMHRFIQDFHHGDFAVHDLGLVSYHRPEGEYVLDIYGLASSEASAQANKSPAWLEGIVKRHKIPLVMMYPNWFTAPLAWTPLAQLCLDRPHQVVSESCVIFYSTSPANLQQDREEIRRFAPTVPAPATLLVYPTDYVGSSPSLSK